MKLSRVISHLKDILEMFNLCDTPLEISWHKFFFTRYWYFFNREKQAKISFWCIFFVVCVCIWVIIGCFNEHDCNFVDVSKNGYSKCLWKKGLPKYTDKILSHDSNFTADVFMWPKFGESCIFMREVIVTSILWLFDPEAFIPVIVSLQWFINSLSNSYIQLLLKIIIPFSCGEINC